MTVAVKMAFEGETVTVPLSKLLPTKALSKECKATTKYRDIGASVPVVGIIEPPIVCRQADGNYLILDGHKRVSLLQDAGATEVECVVSTDDEGYTYNIQTSHLAPIQANKMILKALDAGASETRLAEALNLSPTTIRMSRTMLKDICPEALELLKDKPVAVAAFCLFKHVKPLRQIEMAELMNKVANYSKSYAAALVSATKPDLVAELPKGKKPARPKPEDLIRMEMEMQSLERDITTNLPFKDWGKLFHNSAAASAIADRLVHRGLLVHITGKSRRSDRTVESSQQTA